MTARARLEAVRAHDGWRLTLPPGAIAALPSDDATLPRWLAGHVRAAAGDHLVVDGRELRRHSTAGRVRRGVVLIGDVEVAAEVSVRDHLAARTSPARATSVLHEVPRLAGRDHDPAGVLSGGERRLLAWARAALLAPRVVVLDRAGTGLDAAALAWADARIERWRAHGAVVLVRAGRSEERRWVDDAP